MKVKFTLEGHIPAEVDLRAGREKNHVRHTRLSLPGYVNRCSSALAPSENGEWRQLELLKSVTEANRRRKLKVPS